MSKASSLERLMLDLINEERRGVGLDPLRLELRLNDSSESHSEWMLQTDRFSHDGDGGSFGRDRMRDAGFPFEGRWIWGENIALQSERGAPGLADDVRGLHDGLMNSPVHRAHILNPDFEAIGVGIETGSFKRFDAVAVTQNFARTAADLRIDGAAPAPGPDPQPQPEPQPRPNPAEPEGEVPQLSVRDFSLEPGRYTSLKRYVEYEDAEGDAPLRFEIDAPEDGRVRIAGRTVDAEDGHVFDAGDFGRTIVQYDPAGRDQTFRTRVDDGDGWSAWDDFTITARGGPARPAPEPAPPSDRLALEVDDIVIGVGERVKLADFIEVTTDGDPVRAFKIEDADGGPGLWKPHRGEVDASGGLWVGASAIGRLYVEADDAPSVREMRILVNDGDDRTGWETFTVTTEWEGA